MRSTDSTDSLLVHGDPLVLRRCRLTDRIRARALGASLDRQLAAGRSAESAPLLAARAQDIVALRRRRALARDWEHLLTVARRAPRRHPPAAPIQSDRIAAAEPAVRELVQRLIVPLPVTAQGVATASVLLTDAGGPVYHRYSPITLSAALEAAIAQLDPALPLMGTTTRTTRAIRRG
jgi:hypothetical protein